MKWQNITMFIIVFMQKAMAGWIGLKMENLLVHKDFRSDLEAIEIKLVEKGGAAPGPTNKPFIFTDPSVVYSTHVQDIGWQEACF